MGDNRVPESHESYGIIGISRIQSNKETNLFGSAINHRDWIVLRIFHGEKERHLNNDFYYPKSKAIIEVALSATQFSEFITSANQGSGVPCTIQYLDGVRMQDPPEFKSRELYESEFNAEMREITKIIKEDVEKIDAILDSRTPMRIIDRKTIKSCLNRLVKIIDDHIPFIQRSFNRSLDKVTLEAKMEVESFLYSRLDKLKQLGFDEEPQILKKGELKLNDE